jgi:predicted DNA-binding transcriptional regulator AlpA
MEEMLQIVDAAKLVGTSRQRIYNAMRRDELRPVAGLPVPLLLKADVLAWSKLPKHPGWPPKKISKISSKNP